MPQENDAAARIVTLFKQIQRRFRKRILEVPGLKEFTLPQIMTFHILMEQPGLTLTELSQRLSLAKSTVSGIVDRMVEHGYLVREIPEENRRVVRLRISDSAWEMKDTLGEIKHLYTAELLQKATPDQMTKILEGLELLDQLMEQTDQEAQP